MVKYLVKYKAHKLDKSFDQSFDKGFDKSFDKSLDKSIDKSFDKDEDEEEDYTYTRSDFAVNNGLRIRHQPKRACKKCKVIKQITGFVLKNYICKDCNAGRNNCEHCSSIVIFSGSRSHIKRVHRKAVLCRPRFLIKRRVVLVNIVFYFLKLKLVVFILMS